MLTNILRERWDSMRRDGVSLLNDGVEIDYPRGLCFLAHAWSREAWDRASEAWQMVFR